jgi:hypothetical protein
MRERERERERDAINHTVLEKRDIIIDLIIT